MISRLAYLWVAVLPALAAAAPAARPSTADPTLELARAWAREARALSTSPRAIAPLASLHALRDEVEDLNVLAEAYADVLFARRTHPEVRRVVRRLYADLERARGRQHKAKELLEPLGFVDAFYVTGAFDNEGKGGCATDFGPEARLDLEAVYPAKQGEAGWRKLEVDSPDGYVDLSSVLRPNQAVVAYALALLESRAETRAELSVGTSGGFRLFVNGELAASSDRYNHPRPDQARVAVRLRRGVNRVLLKVCHEEGPFGFYLRRERGAGGSASAHPVLPPKLPALERGPPPQPKPLATAAELLAREVARRPQDARLRGDYASVLGFTRAFERSERTDQVEADRAAEAAPADEVLQLRAAALHGDDANLRRAFLARALEAAPDSPHVRLALARYELERRRPERALDLLEPLVARFPNFNRAHLALADAWGAYDASAKAARLYEDAFRRAPRIPSAVIAAARVSRRLDRLDEAVERYRVALGLRFDDDDARRALTFILADLGKNDAAAHELRTVLRLSPYDNATRLRLAELLAANGQLEEGLRLFADAKALCPDDPEIHEREGRVFLQAGRRDGALASFERALALRPQNPALREALRTLQGADASYGVEHAFDVAPLMREAEAWIAEDAVYLADYQYTRVQPTGLSSLFHQLAVKVNSQRGADAFRTFPITYAPDRQEVQVLKVRITRPDGSVVESYGESDRAINEPWSGMYYDARARELSFPSLAPGDVLELRYRVEDTARENLLSDYWGDVAYVQAIAPKLRYRYVVDMPASRPLYWNRAQLPPGIKAEESATADGRVLYSWSASHLTRVVPEPGMPGWAEVAATLHVSTYRTWEEVGRYWWGLVRDQLTPNEELRRTTDEALRGVDRADELAVVRAIYDFVVTHTRYVALEFGIHGYKPYRVDRVLARRFGDCKDKASLIHAMLKHAGVDSRLVLLRMRHLGALAPEPASLAAFNHAIVYVPRFELWLDGTASFHGATELPPSDRAANVLVVEPDGKSTFLTTPEANPRDNATELSLEVALGADGTARITGSSRVHGVQAPEYRRAYQAPATRKAAFEQGWAQTFPGLKVAKVSVNDVAHLSEAVNVSFEMDVPRYAEALPSSLRFHPFGGGRGYAQTFAPLVERSHDLVMTAPWANTFTFRYALPDGYAAGELPADVDEVTPFGSLRLRHRVEGGKLVAEGDLVISVARVAAKDYPAFRAFLGRVDQAFARKVTLTRSAVKTAAP